MTISCAVAGFLPLLQSGPRLTLNTQGSAKPPPWAKFLYRLRGYFFAVFAFFRGYFFLFGARFGEHSGLFKEL